MKAKILSLHWLFWICKSTWAFAIICAYLFRLDIAIEICPKLKDGSASVANQTGETPLPHGLALQIHFACLPRSSKSSLQMPKNVTLFQNCTEKTWAKFWTSSFCCTFLGVEAAVAAGALAASAAGSSQKLGGFSSIKNGCNENGCHQPMAVLSVFLGLFAFHPFFHLWELRFGRLRSQWDDWITRDGKASQRRA